VLTPMPFRPLSRRPSRRNRVVQKRGGFHMGATRDFSWPDLGGCVLF